MTEIRYLDADKNPVVAADKGYAILKRTYNENGQLDTESYYDENENPINISGSYAMIQYVYDELGDEEDRIYRDKDGVVVERQPGL